MWRWMGSHFHDWTDYNGVAFSIELLEWGRTFSNFWVGQFFIFTVSKRTRMFVLSVKSEVFFIQYSVDTWIESDFESRKLHISPKVTKVGSIIGHRTDYNGVRALRGQRHIPSKINPSTPSPPPRKCSRRGPRKIARSSHYVNVRKKDNFVGNW